ncbi:hypothetical protein PHMEG_00028041, partial [Phytophthora megakarya]
MDEQQGLVVRSNWMGAMYKYGHRVLDDVKRDGYGRLTLKNGENFSTVTHSRTTQPAVIPPASVKQVKATKNHKVTRTYEYHSQRTYSSASSEWNEAAKRQCTTGKLRAVQALAVDQLPTAMVNYSHSMTVDALIVGSNTEDFLVGEDWMYDHGVKINFVSSEMKWFEN